MAAPLRANTKLYVLTRDNTQIALQKNNFAELKWIMRRNEMKRVSSFVF